MTMENFQTIQISRIIPNQFNPRVIKEESESFKHLCDSISAAGVLIPVHVRPSKAKKDKYELLAGTRRLRACEVVKRQEVPAMIHVDCSDAAAFEITFNENFAREDLTVFEESRAVEMLLEKYGGDIHAVASRMGKTRCWVRQRTLINSGLTEEWKEYISDPEYGGQNWTASHLQLIAGLPAELQDELLEQCQYDFPAVKDLEDYIRERMMYLRTALFNTDESMTVTRGEKEIKLTCSKCQDRTSRQPYLFDDLDPEKDSEEIAKEDRCLNPDCWKQKTRQFLKFRAAELKGEYKELAFVADEISHGDRGDLKKEFGQVSFTYEYTASKPKAKGAIAALVIAGPNIGQVQFIKPNERSQTSSQTRPKGEKKSLDEKMIELNSKRWQQVLREMVKLIGDSDIDMIQTDNVDEKVLFIMSIATVFGTHTNWKDSNWKSFEELYRKVKSATGYEEICKALWEKVKPVLTSQFCYNGPITQVPQNLIDDAKILAGYLGIDIDSMFKKQEIEIPIPKSWDVPEGKQASKKGKKASKQ